MRRFKHVAALVVAVAAFVAIPSSAMAEPATGYEEFAGCPDKSVAADIVSCLSTVVDSGNLKLGSKNTPIIDPITLVGSVREDGQLPLIVGSFDGGRQLVPGGLVGLSGLDWLSWLFPFSLLAVHAEAELAGQPGNPLLNVFPLPLKVKLDNALLADSCYIGSNTNPVALNLTFGTTNPPPPNQPITGQGPTFTPDPNYDILRLLNGQFVDNAFAAPAASGCDLLGVGLIDVLVNAQAGLPSAAGRNEARQNFDGAGALIESIYPPNGIDQ